jgi:transcriptional regulator with XRE-family HTH domain
VTTVLPLRQRLIGATLRRYREDAGYDLPEAARILRCDRSKVSRIEAGERGIRLAELRELLDEYGTDEPARDTLEALAQATRYGWWQDYRRILSAGYLDLLIAESVAAQITIYAPLQVPELLHTGDYARAVALACSGGAEQVADAAVAAAMARQQAVLHESGTTVAVVLGEAALRALRLPGGHPGAAVHRRGARGEWRVLGVAVRPGAAAWPGRGRWPR